MEQVTVSLNTELNYGSSPEQIERREISEILDQFRSEMAFQSYEQFNNNSGDVKSEFISDQNRNPNLEYPAFKAPNYLASEVDNLKQVLESVGEIETDEFKKDVISSTVKYRLAELSYVQTLAELDTAVKSDKHEQTAKSVELARNLNEQLYGRPNPEIVDGILNQIWGKIDGKELIGEAKTVYDELKNGFEIDGKFVSGLPVAENPQARLPEFDDDPSLAWAGEYILNKNGDLEALVRELWEQKAAVFGDGYEATPLEIKEFFENALLLRDPEGKSGVKIVIDPDARALSWNSAKLAVVIGAKRGPIKTTEEMFAKILHEFGVHGQRALNGFKTDLPVLGSGLFTNTKRADYLTFEEGLATMLEAAVKGEKTDWNPANMGLYLNVALAEAGHDFREVYELSWRYRVLFDAKSGQNLTPEQVNKQKSLSYDAVVRVFRGNPTNLSEIDLTVKPLTYNKDLAYLNGRVDVMNYFRQIWQSGDVDKLDDLFAGKFDPTVPEQYEIVRRFAKI